MGGLVFATIGGSGSEYLVASLERLGYRVARRVDAPWLPADKPFEDRNSHQHILSLSDAPSLQSLAEFARRGGDSNGALPDPLTVGGLLHHVVRFTQADQGRAALLCRAHSHGFYTAAWPEDIVFLVRHPRHAYLSHCQPDRNEGDWAPIGGRCRASVRVFAAEWMALVEQYVALKNAGRRPVLARFEDCRQQFTKDRVLHRVFKTFAGAALNRNRLQRDLDAYLGFLCAPGFSEVYNDMRWEDDGP